MEENQAMVDQIFLEGRTHSHWHEKPIEISLIEEAYNRAKMGPTSVNCCPLRFAILSTQESKEKLKPALMEGNVDKTMSAPLVLLMAYDLKFYDHLGFLFPHADVKGWFEGNPQFSLETVQRNGTLQAAYFIMALRSVGLDCGPMSGFDGQKVDDLFFSGTSWKTNLICNVGYGVKEKLFPRSPRFDMDDVSILL